MDTIIDASTVITVQIDNDFTNIALTQANLKQVLFTFKECQTVVMLASRTSNPLTLPTYKEDLKVLSFNDNITINENEQDKHLMPGIYPIRVNDDVYYYKVLPQHQAEEEYDAMVTEISSYVGSHIFSNNRLKQLALSSVKDADSVSSVIISLNKIIHQLKIIDPVGNKNLTRSLPSRGLSLTANTSENCKLLGELNLLLRHLAFLKRQVRAKLQDLNLQIEEKNSAINYMSSELEITRQNESYLWVNQIHGSLRGTSQELEQAVKEKEGLLNLFAHIVKSESFILEQVSALTLAGCYIPKRNITCKAIKYQSLFSLIRNFLQGVELNHSRKELKSTYQLFEYSSLIKVFKALSVLKFIDNEQLLTSELRKLISTGSCSISNGNTQLVLNYDMQCPLNVKDSYKGIVSINSRHTRPDLVIYKYVNNSLADILVIEVKYRRAGFLYNQNYYTKVFNTILDYKQFGYIENGQLQFGKVGKVLLIYPADGQQVKVDSQIHQQICSFISMNMAEDCSELLNGEIKRFLE